MRQALPARPRRPVLRASTRSAAGRGRGRSGRPSLHATAPHRTARSRAPLRPHHGSGDLAGWLAGQGSPVYRVCVEIPGRRVGSSQPAAVRRRGRRAQRAPTLWGRHAAAAALRATRYGLCTRGRSVKPRDSIFHSHIRHAGAASWLCPVHLCRPDPIGSLRTDDAVATMTPPRCVLPEQSQATCD